MRAPPPRALALALLLCPLTACSSCDEEAAPSPTPQSSTEASEEEPTSAIDPRWTATDVEGLAAAGAATVVELRRGGISVDNRPLVERWPAPAQENAAAADPGDEPGWPRVVTGMPNPRREGQAHPWLTETLTVARRVEASATGAPAGAGVYDLRVAPDASFRAVPPVLYSASLAGYGLPRLRLQSEEGERVVPWPASPRAEAAPIQAALDAFESGGDIPEVAPTAAGPRVVVTAHGVALRDGDVLRAPGCDDPAPEGATRTYPSGVSPDEVIRCAEAIGPAPWTLEVEGGLDFARVAPLLVRLFAREEPLRIITR